MALLFLAVFAALAVALFAGTGKNLAQAANLRLAVDARLAAESGLGFTLNELTTCDVSGYLRGQPLLDDLASHISSDLNGTANLKGATVGYDGATITIPEIAVGDGMSFSAQITVPSSDVVRLHVTGCLTRGAGQNKTTLQRGITLNLHPTGDPAFGYAVCSEGPIAIGMNMDFEGSYISSDGSMYSSAPGTAISFGSGYISGDVCVSDPNAVISLGATNVGGSVRYDAPPITMPTVDRSAYAPLATRIVDSHTDTSSGTFKNIRIKANTNPVFGSVTIQGVMYVEAPNNIQFANDVNFTAVLVADDPPAGSPDSANYISFKNNATLYGVENLPDNSDFHKIRSMIGTSVLAPGFTLEFKNNFGSICGTAALKGLIAKNNLTTTMYGNLLIYGQVGLTFKNNLTVKVDRSKYPGVPPGFPGYAQNALATDPPTYAER